MYVLRRGEVVVDRAYGVERDSLFWLFSVSKPYVAMLVHLLAERGRLDLDAPIATYWPEFGASGKAEITARHVLRHRAGIPTAGVSVGDVLAMPAPEVSVRRVERATPRWPAGAVPAYHLLTFGVILGEVVRRVTGRPVREVLDEELLSPLGLRDTYLGLPDDQLARHVPLRVDGPLGPLAAGILNRPATQQAPVPAAGVSTTARDVARFYLMLLRGGELDGVRVLRQDTVENARRPTSNGELDRFLKHPARWSEGFRLAGPRGEEAGARFGTLASPLTFGHNGSGCCIAWADPTRDLAFALLTDRLPVRQPPVQPYQTEIADAILAACPPL